jgi:hypothetical protein
MLPQLARGNRRIVIDPIDMVFYASIGEVMERVVEPPHLSIHDDFVVRLKAGPSRAIAPK